jgi:tetratricopeptide (TPR) repeat protein
MHLKEYDLGLLLLGRNLDKLAPSTDQKAAGMQHYVLARILFGMEQYRPAASHFQRALTLNRKAGRQDVVRDIVSSLREIDVKMKHLDEK